MGEVTSLGQIIGRGHKFGSDCQDV